MKKIIVSLCLLFSLLVFCQDRSKATEIWLPNPTEVKTGEVTSFPPSDAIILFNGKNFSNWQNYSGELPKWLINGDGSMEVINGTGGIRTKESYGSVQLHIEWKTSKNIGKYKGQQRSNSGVFLQGRYEIQILDSYNNPTYVNGQAGSVYKQYIPLVNASKPPGEWQSYDIIFNAPVFENNDLVKPGFFTVFHNGVLIHDNVEILGTTTNVGSPKYEPHDDGPLVLQDHCCTPLSFRNIWLRKLSK